MLKKFLAAIVPKNPGPGIVSIGISLFFVLAFYLAMEHQRRTVWNRRSEAEATISAVYRYFDEHGTWPTRLGDLRLKPGENALPSYWLYEVFGDGRPDYPPSLRLHGGAMGYGLQYHFATALERNSGVWEQTSEGSVVREEKR